MVIDAITYHNEADIFDLRYNILKDYVDEFVVVEAVSTFSTEPKELNFLKIKDRYPKVKYYVNEDKYTPEEIEQARTSPNTEGIPRWMHEFLQKEAIKKAITHLKDDDIVFVGDVDEIWMPGPMGAIGIKKLRKLKLDVYAYYLNNHSSEEFWGTVIGKYKEIKNECLNHLRTNAIKTDFVWGWHFTNQGGLETVKQKVLDQYNPEAFGTQTWDNLENRFGKEDYIGRPFTFQVDESDWPQYLKDNKEKYQHLCK